MHPFLALVISAATVSVVFRMLFSLLGLFFRRTKVYLYLQEQVFTENDGFYAWMFLKRRTLWQTILSFVWPLFALAVCLFPVYPYQCKIVVLYSCAGALLFIVSLLLCKILSPNLSHTRNIWTLFCGS
jgi:hypothetical protein